MRKSTPIIIGVVTAAIMIVLAILPFYINMNPQMRYIVYAIYAAGIVLSLLLYSRSASYTGTFGGLFNQGFRCFIVVTLIMVVFTAIFVNMHPELAEENAAAYRKELFKEEKSRTAAEKEQMVADYKKGFNTQFVSSSIFGYLIAGAVFTVAGSAGLLLFRRK